MDDFSCDFIPLPAAARAAVPYLEQYFGLWAMRVEDFRAGVEWATKLDLHLHLQSDQAAKAQAGGDQATQLRGEIAVVTLHGPLMKQVSSMSGGTSTVMARRQIRAATANDNIKAILLHADSPGGTVAGTKDLADDVAEAAKHKPVYAYIEDLGASALMWVVSQATKVFANETAFVGSIGTYGVIHDLSALAEKEGVKVHVIKAGEFKGMGEPGTAVTDQQLQELQRLVNEQNEFFIRGVAKGRGLSVSRVRELADGRVHVGKAAADLGLIDGVQTLDATFAQLVKASKKGTQKMSQEKETTVVAATAVQQAATYDELKSACVGADPAFICAQQDRKATVAQAQQAWMAEQNTRLQASRAETEAAKAKKSGVDPVPTGGKGASQPAGDPVAEWQDKVAAKVQAGMSPKRATSAVNRENPGLREQMLVAYNREHDRAKAAEALTR